MQQNGSVIKLHFHSDAKCDTQHSYKNQENLIRTSSSAHTEKTKKRYGAEAMQEGEHINIIKLTLTEDFCRKKEMSVL